MNRIIIDVETAGGLENPLVYDLGFKVVDGNFNKLTEGNFVIEDVFVGMPLEMHTAYYAEKLPQYFAELANGTRQMVSLAAAFEAVADACETFNVNQAWAFNACFDRRALNNTCRVVSRGAVCKFMPANVEWRCIQGAATSTFMNSRNYFKFAVACGMVSECGNVRTTAEAAYRYLSGNPEFEEAHTGLCDVEIEAVILAKALQYHKKMNTAAKAGHWRNVQAKFKACTA